MPALFSCVFWECLQNSFERLLVEFDVQVCELFVYNGDIHSCQLQKHRRPFNRVQPFLVKPWCTAEQREQNAADWSGTGVWEPSNPSDSPAALCFSHTHTDRT